MKILHLTDLHYEEKEKKILRLKNIVTKVIDAVNKEEQVDLLFFTGDIVDRGDKKEDFYEAKNVLLDEISDKCAIPLERIFIVPGNHDIFRNQELEEISDALWKIDNNNDLDEFSTKDGKRSLLESLRNLDNYNEFFRTEFIDNTGDTFSDGMFSTHIREIEGTKIGITTINTAWRCKSSKTDYGNLKYPVHYLRKAVDEVKDCEFKILLMHHPLSDLVYWNSQTLEDIIHTQYHMLFTGHTHKNGDSIHLNEGIGIYHCATPATLCNDNEGKIGFTTIDVDLESYNLNIYNFKFLEENFVRGNLIPAAIPVDEEKRKLNKLRETLNKRFNENSEEADKLFLSYKEREKDNSFINLFTDPIIKSEPQTSGKESRKISLDEILTDKRNHLIIGKDKTGKSTILFKLLLEALKGFSRVKTIPIYIDCKSYLKTGEELQVINHLHTYLELSKRKVEETLNEYGLILLLDNFNPERDNLMTPLQQIESEYNLKVIATTSETIFNTFANYDDSIIEFEERYIYDITRNEIRALTEKWPNLSDERKKEILEKINSLFKQLNIPPNYWTVSLFLWIFEKNSNINFVGNFQIIEYYIENLLDKEGFIKATQRKIDYEDLKTFLAELAHHLITEHSNNLYRFEYTELVNFTNEYKSKNKKFVIDVDEIVEIILDKGIIKKDSTSQYTFRLNGVFEYFLGYFMSFNGKFRNEIIDDPHVYLSFRNEFEICAGFIPHDKDYVQKIYNKTKAIYKELNSRFNLNDLDTELKVKIEKGLDVDLGLNKALKEGVTEPLSYEDQDKMMEDMLPAESRISEVQEKKFYHEIENNIECYEAALHILGRVFRNSKLRDAESFNEEVFDFILDSSCTMGFALLEDIEQSAEPSDFNVDSPSELIQVVTKIIPVVVQTFFYDSTVQVNLERIILDKIERLKKQPQTNQFKLLVLYFSLIDLDLKANEKYIPEIIEILKIPMLQQSSLIKLYVYLSLKVNHNKRLQKNVELHIRSQEKKFDSDKSDERKKEIEARINSAKKEALKNKGK